MNVGLQKKADPACPGCGCEDCPIVARRNPWGRAIDTRRCGHCGKTFSAGQRDDGDDDSAPPPAPADKDTGAGGAIFKIMRCPQCQSKDIRVTSTRRPLRWHRCNQCRHPFKSYEE